jgi:hypothetical protein
MKFMRTELITAFVIGRWGFAIVTLPYGQPRRLVLWIPGRQPIVHPPFPIACPMCVGGPVSYVR